MRRVVGRVLFMWLALAALILYGSGSVFAAGYSVQNVGAAREITGINDSGQLTGYYADAGNQLYQSFFYGSGTTQPIKTGINAFTFGVSDDGTTAGWARDEGALGPVRAFTWKDGTVTETGAFTGGVNSYAYATSKSGTVVGEAHQQLGGTEDTLAYYAFSYKNGTMTNLGALPGAGGYGDLSDAAAINDNGQAAGSSRVGYQRYDDLHRAVLFGTGGTVTDLGNLGGNRSEAGGINNLGQVIGTSEVLDSVLGYDGAHHAFMYNNGALVDLGTFGGYDSVAEKINNSGKVVGYATDSAASRAFIYTDWTLKNIDTVSGSKGSAANDISDGGRVVGYFTGSDSVRHAFLYTEGSGLTDLNDLLPPGSGWVLNEAHKVNEKGQIAGIGAYNGTTHGFLLTPTVSVTAFAMPATASSLTVPVSSFTAQDSDGTVSYLITESADVPAASDTGWGSTAPSAYTFSGSGAKTAHAWVKDATGVISADVTAGVTITPPAITLTAGLTNPQLAGTAVTFTATTGSYEYRFKLSADNGTTWSEVQAYSTTNTWTMPDSTVAGIYTVSVDVRAAGTTVPRDATASINFRINSTAMAAAATGVTISDSATSPQPVGTAVTFTALGAGSSAYEYRFSLYKFGEWKVVQNYSSTDNWTLPADSPRGSYAVKVDVRGAGSISDSEANHTVNYVVRAPAATGAAFVESGNEWPAGKELAVVYTTTDGGNHQFIAKGIGSNAYEYRFRTSSDGGTTWTVVQDWSINHFWNLINAPLGIYTLRVDVRGRGSLSADGEAYTTMAYRVAGSPATSVTLSSGLTSPQNAGTAVTFTAQAQATSQNPVFEYRFLLNAVEVQAYSSATSWILPSTTSAGSYAVTVQVRGAGSAVQYDAYKTMDFQLTSTVASDVSVTSFTMPAEVAVGSTSITWKLTDVGSSAYNVNGTETNGINRAGQIIGLDYTGFLLDGSGRTDLVMANPRAINEAGQVVGFTFGYQLSYAYLYDKGTLTKLTPLTGYPMAAAHAINNNGLIAGSSQTASDVPETRATIWNNGVASALPDLDGTPAYGEALGINDSGDAAGYKVLGRAGVTDLGTNRAVFWKNGTMIDLSGSCTTGPSCGSVARAVNNAGVVVGDYNDQPGGVTWINGEPNALPQIDGSQSSHPRAINNLGQVAGYRITIPNNGAAEERAVLWEKGVVVDLNALIGSATYTLVRAEGINDNGEIVGTMAVAGKQEAHHFLLSPVVSLPVTVSFTASASGTASVAGYLLTDSNVTPSATDSGWSTTIPTSYSFTGFGPKKVCAWVKDLSGNVSPGVCQTVNITRTVVDWFSMPSTSNSRTVPISKFSGHSSIGVNGYLVTESATAPATTDSGWSATPQSSFTFSGYGAKTAYAWVKDTAGNVSTAFSATVTIATPPTVTAFTMRPFAFGGGSASGGAWLVTNLGKTLNTSLISSSPSRVLSKNGQSYTSIANSISNSGLIAGAASSLLSAGGGARQGEAVFWTNDGTTTTAVDLGYAYYGGSNGKSQALNSNNNGQIVGNTRGTATGTYPLKPFKYSLAGNAVLVGMPSGATSAYATAINDSGQIVGYSSTSTTISTGDYAIGTAFIWKSDTNVYSLIGAASGNSRADAINNSGIVVGTSGSKAFRYDSVTDTFNNLGTINTGGSFSSANAINDSALIVGVSSTSTTNVYHAFLSDGTTMTDLGALGGATKSSVARGINSFGMVVGNTGMSLSATPTSGAVLTNVAIDTSSIGFIYLNGTMIDLNTMIDPASGFTISNATGINDKGQIVGYGKDSSFKFTVGTTSYDYSNYYHALLLTPVWSEDATVSPLTVPVKTLTVTKGSNDIAGYLITESATPPSATDSGWSATIPAGFTFADYGTRTAYAWAKDTAGIVSAALSQQVLLVQPPKPAVSAFAMPATSKTLTVPVTTFTAGGFAGVKGYLVTESPVAPTATDAGWSVAAPSRHTFSGDGEHTAYAWVKDAAGTVSAALSATVTITRDPVTVTLDNPAFTYDGTAKAVSATTNPAGRTVIITYNGSATVPTNAGSYAVVATVNEDAYQGSATGTLTIATAAATVNLGNLTSTYDGTAKAATATTTPAGLNVTITYNGSATALTAAGSYAVVATINDANYQGAATGTLTINKAAPVITWNNPAGIVSGTALGTAQLNATASVPGAFAYTPAAGLLLEPGSRTLAVTFTPNDAGNYTTATTTVSLKVIPGGNMDGGATVTIADALLALRSAVGLHTPTALEISRADVSPLVGGIPAPDGKLDIGDAVVILRRITGLVSW